MAICNLFNTLDKHTGNFMMFSQYVEDITRNYTESDNWKVVPSRFIALNIDYNKINKNVVSPTGDDLNISIPKYFQNYFENACAYGRTHYADYASKTSVDIIYKNWNPLISRNLFWNSMFDGGFLTRSDYGKTKIVNEIKYWGDINLQSYDEHQGMGYNEIYCYIPVDGKKMNCQCISVIDNSENNIRIFDESNTSIFLEGHTDKQIEQYSKKYYYNKDFELSVNDDIDNLLDSNDLYYDINTVIVLYDVLKKVNDTWQTVYSYIPMGMYLSGKFDNNNQLSNITRKYVTTDYGTGTSYGLRLCTRFTISPKDLILKETDITVNSNDYNTLGQLMTKMSECINKMLEITQTTNNTTQNIKDTMAIIKNNRTNVPYIKNINGNSWWFVNGKAIGSVTGNTDSCCDYLSDEVITQRINNLKDNNPDNDYTWISDGTGCECFELSPKELAKELGVEYNGPDYSGGSVTENGDIIYNEFDTATNEDIAGKLWIEPKN